MIKQRLLDICQALGISASELSTTIGKSRPYIANLKKDISSETLLNIYINYPSVNILRIITGEGEVLLNKEKQFNAGVDMSFFVEKYNQLEKENKELLLEIGELKGQLKELKALKKHAPEENNSR